MAQRYFSITPAIPTAGLPEWCTLIRKVRTAMHIDDLRKLAISIASFLALWAFFVWAVAHSPRPGN
jgi:hypothetical protein